MGECVGVSEHAHVCARTHTQIRTHTHRERERERERRRERERHTHKDNLDEVTCLVLIGGQNFPPSAKKETLHLARFVPTVNACTCHRQRAQCVNAPK